MDEMLKVCIQQGYVPDGCKLDGTLVFLLVKDGKSPCDGCNADCIHSRSTQKYEWRDCLSEKEREQNARISKRKRLGTSREPILYVDADYKSVLLMVMNPDTERAYINRCKNIVDAANIIPCICRAYQVRQVYIDLNGFGIGIMDYLKQINFDKNDNVDIVPMFCSQMKLS